MERLYNILKGAYDIVFALIYILVVMLFVGFGFYFFASLIIGAIVGGFIGLMVGTGFMMWYAKDSNCNKCKLFSEQRCRFSQSFIEGCKEGRAMVCYCRECVIRK